jgi:hypothetical protein
VTVRKPSSLLASPLGRVTRLLFVTSGTPCGGRVRDMNVADETRRLNLSHRPDAEPTSSLALVRRAHVSNSPSVSVDPSTASSERDGTVDHDLTRGSSWKGETKRGAALGWALRRGSAMLAMNSKVR